MAAYTNEVRVQVGFDHRPAAFREAFVHDGGLLHNRHVDGAEDAMRRDDPVLRQLSLGCAAPATDPSAIDAYLNRIAPPRIPA